MKIVLIGFMGSGKSTIARELGKQLHKEVIEMDSVVLERTECTDMAHVFEKGGEILLREWEIKLAKEWKDASDVIISTGGGVVMNKIILDYLKENEGQVIFLHSSFETIHDRIQQDNTPRPLFQHEEEAKKLYDFRLPLYKQYADHEVDCDDKSVEEIVSEIKSFI